MLDANEVSAAQQKEVQQARAAEQQRLDAEFTKLDTNHDGQLSKAEFMAAAPPVQARATAQQIVAQVDANKDGKVSLQEYESGPMASFNRLDANHDGTVTPQEIQAARSAKK
jgi:Ca2+-binding EF-hand superfamily protein